MFYTDWYKIYMIQNDEYLYLYYRASKGFYWGESIFATLFLMEHTQFDNKLISYLNDYDYYLEKCEEIYPYHSHMKYHGKIN